MAKRKRGQTSAKAQPRAEDEYNPADSKLRIKTYEDIADSEDEFHAGRDEVLLDAARGSKRRKPDDDIMEMSDEEVLGAASDEDDEEVYEDDEEAGERSAEEEEDLGGYGASAADYYGADVLENEQDALEEEEEARRIQQKNLKALKAADFGFDENDWLGAGEEGVDIVGDEDNAVTEVLPQLQITEDMGPAERLKLLKQRYPLFEPLSKDFLALQDRHQELAGATASLKVSPGGLAPVSLIQYHALSGYLGALAMYFALLTSTATSADETVLPLAPQELQNHLIFASIERCQRTWNKVKDLTDLPQDESESAGEQEPEQLPTPPPETSVSAPMTKVKKAKKARPPQADAATLASEDRRAVRLARTEASLATLTTLPRPRITTKSTTPTTIAATITEDADSDIGDEAPLSSHDAAEKERKRKSLRFYTSQIAQKANKRANAGRSAGGDDDVPYRERFRDRQERLNREAEARGKKGRGAAEGAELGGEDDEDEDVQMTNREREEAGTDDADSAALFSRIAAKKSSKASRDAVYAAAAAEGGRVIRVSNSENDDGDGKRGVTYQIEKNKGLMPRRKKDVKNPRVKKRKKYEEKTKKLASMKPVYKGGEGRGGYQGQLTGTKSNLIRSVKL